MGFVAATLFTSESLILVLRHMHCGFRAVFRSRAGIFRFTVHILVCFSHLTFGLLSNFLEWPLYSPTLLLPHLVILIPTILIDLQQYRTIRSRQWTVVFPTSSERSASLESLQENLNDLPASPNPFAAVGT